MKSKNFKYLIIFVTILIYGQLIEADELLELSCLNETQCRQFQHAGIKSLCMKEQCHCFTTNGETVACKPMDSKMNNIIGGACPCKQPNAECDKQQDVCYCAKDYMSSSDKRRCIPKIVDLNKKCEQTSQCQKTDFNAICDSKECKCMDQFINNDGKCASIVGNNTFVSNDTQCQERYGANTKYNNKNQHCICMPGYFASIDNSYCLKISKYLENCTENLQCIGTMGPGGICKENVCQCSEKYIVEEKKTAEGTIKTVCTGVVERGHYCRFNEDCYQRQLNENEQSMDCIYGECSCKNEFYSYNESDCIAGVNATFKSLAGLQFMIVLSFIANKYFS